MRSLVAAWRRLASTRLVAVVGPIILPVLGVAFLGWDVWTLIVLYWLETALIGIAALPRIGDAEGPPTPGSDEPPVDLDHRGNLQASFAVGCGATFLWTSAVIFSVLPRILGEPKWDLLDLLFFVIAVGLLAVAQVRSYGRFRETEEYLRVSPASQGNAPFRRMTVLWSALVAALVLGLVFPGAAPPLLVILGRALVQVYDEFGNGPIAT